MQNAQSYRLLPIFTGLFVACLIISNIAAAKFVQIGTFTLAGATLIFPFSFIFGDILTEVYGFAQSRKVIWTGFASIIVMSLFLTLIRYMPAPDFWQNQAAFDSILGTTFRVALASIAAYSTGEFCNSVVLSRMKYWAQGKRGLAQAWRFIASTIVGEALDTIVFFTVAFAGVLTWPDITWAMISTYIFKVGIEVVLTPISLPFSNWVKRVEGVDHIDRPQETSYNPFVASL
jgi:hypothetical protein